MKAQGKKAQQNGTFLPLPSLGEKVSLSKRVKENETIEQQTRLLFDGGHLKAHKLYLAVHQPCNGDRPDQDSIHTEGLGATHVGWSPAGLETPWGSH